MKFNTSISASMRKATLPITTKTICNTSLAISSYSVLVNLGIAALSFAWPTQFISSRHRTTTPICFPEPTWPVPLQPLTTLSVGNPIEPPKIEFGPYASTANFPASPTRFPDPAVNLQLIFAGNRHQGWWVAALWTGMWKEMAL